MSGTVVEYCIQCNQRPRYGNFPFCGKTCARIHKDSNPSPSTPVRRGHSANAGGPPRRDYRPATNGSTLSPPQRPALAAVTPPRPPQNLPTIPDNAPLDQPSNPTPGNYSSTDTSSTLATDVSELTGSGSGFMKASSSNGGSRILTPTAPVVGERDPSAPKCAFPGCEAAPYLFGAEYCSMEHRKAAADKHLVSRCARCKQLPVTLFNFCGTYCHDKAAAKAPQIFALDDYDAKYQEIKGRFELCWKDDQKKVPTIKQIWKIAMTKSLMESYFTYRKTIEAKRNFTSQKMVPGNECRKWYGLRRDCAVGDTEENYRLCSSAQCAVCYIIKHSFRKEILWTQRPGQFGSGIYASALSSRADDFAVGYTNSVSPNRAMLLTTVVVGQGLKCTTPRPNYATAPAGYDSLLTETGSSMVFDEVVVYDNNAIRPLWLVIYAPS